jgi:hypothetical protein
MEEGLRWSPSFRLVDMPSAASNERTASGLLRQFRKENMLFVQPQQKSSFLQTLPCHVYDHTPRCRAAPAHRQAFIDIQISS